MQNPDLMAALAPILGALQGAMAAPQQPPGQQKRPGLPLGGTASALGGVLRNPQHLARVVGIVVQGMSMLERAGGVSVVLGAGADLLSGRGPSIYQGTLREPNQKAPEVSTNEFRQILRDRSAVVFDTRTAHEYAIGHVPGALNVSQKPGVPLSQYVSDVREIARLVPDKSAPMVLYCNGPNCGKSRRLGDELVEAGYTNVRRYQLGAPAWRALGGLMETTPEGMRYVLEGDRLAVFIDARSRDEFAAGSLPRARSLPLSELMQALDDGRLPMEDYNTRIIVFGRDGEQARELAEAVAGRGFHNVAYFPGSYRSLIGTAATVAMRPRPWSASANMGVQRFS
jgi:rhodanese-related sulfurtransferase